MEITLKKPLPDSPRNILLRAGYNEHHDRRAEQTSFALRLSGGSYPRFHCYFKESETGITFSLHIDQKESSAFEGSGHRHAGEYDGKLVEEELGRIRRWAGAPAAGGSGSNRATSNSGLTATGFQSTSPTLPTSRPPKKRGFFASLFGSYQDED